MAKATERKANLTQRITKELEKSTERIHKIIERNPDAQIAVQLVNAERQATAEKIAPWQNECQTIVNREKRNARTARTNRLIQNGLLVEQYLNCKGASPDVVKSRLENVVHVMGNFPPVAPEENGVEDDNDQS